MRIGIRLQFFALTGLLMAGVVGVTALVSMQSQRDAILKERELRGMSILRSWAAMSKERLMTGDVTMELSMYDFVDVVMKEEPGIAEVILQDASGKILIANDPSRNNTTPNDTIFPRLLFAKQSGSFQIRKGNVTIVEFYYPIQSPSKSLGVARLAISSAGIEQGIRDSLRILFIATAAVVLLGFLLMFGLVVKITGPIKRLTQGVQEFGKRFDPRKPETADYLIEFSAQNELGDVRDAFNEMTKTLKLSLEDGIRLKDEATHDAMTGLYNKRQFQEDFPLLVKTAQERKTPLTMMMLDMDKFKLLNDTVGHKAGDLALQLLAKCIHGKIRERDRAYRVGGDEFVILIVGAGLQVSLQQSERIAEAYDAGKAPENMTGISFGIVELEGHETPEAFFSRADEEMYRVKKAKKVQR